MKICRFKHLDEQIRIGLSKDNYSLLDLTSEGIRSLHWLLEREDLTSYLGALNQENLPKLDVADIRFCAPVEHQEVWAAGVTYLRSKAARMAESKFSATAYDLVYDAERPELFFKSLGQKVVAPGKSIGIRKDSHWSVPEPELAMMLNSRGRIAGYTIGNDMSSRDIEGANLLYLPQAKIYDRSCALGPWIKVGVTEEEARAWRIAIAIQRDGATIFQGETSVNQIKRSLEELAGFLFRSQIFPNGAVLLTGTGVVPPDHFTLQPEDIVRIEISGIGVLENQVEVV